MCILKLPPGWFHHELLRRSSAKNCLEQRSVGGVVDLVGKFRAIAQAVSGQSSHSFEYTRQRFVLFPGSHLPTNARGIDGVSLSLLETGKVLNCQAASLTYLDLRSQAQVGARQLRIFWRLSLGDLGRRVKAQPARLRRCLANRSSSQSDTARTCKIASAPSGSFQNISVPLTR